MRILLLTATLLTAGCATAGDLRTSAVDQSLRSPKPLAVVSYCLQLKFQAPPITAPGGETTFVINNGFSAPVGLLTLTAVPGGTRIDMRKLNNLIGFGNWRSCA